MAGEARASRWTLRSVDMGNILADVQVEDEDGCGGFVARQRLAPNDEQDAGRRK